MSNSQIVEIKDNKIRPKDDWKNWLLPRYSPEVGI